MVSLNQNKHKIRQSMLVPLSVLHVFTFMLIYITITVMTFQNVYSAINNSVNKNNDHFSLTISLQISANRSLTNSPLISEYLNGDKEGESQIREQLTNKVVQSPYLIANIMLPLADIPSLSSYQINGLPSKNNFLSLLDISSFLASEKTSLFFLRHSVIPPTYNFVNYQPEYGLCSLVEKIYDEDGIAVALLISDFNSEKLYQDGFGFSFNDRTTIENIQIQNRDGALYHPNISTMLTQPTKPGLHQTSLNTLIYQNEIALENTCTANLRLIIVINITPIIWQNILLFASLLSVTILLIIATNYISSRFSKKIIGPLEEINENIKRYLE